MADKFHHPKHEDDHNYDNMFLSESPSTKRPITYSPSSSASRIVEDVRVEYHPPPTQSVQYIPIDYAHIPGFAKAVIIFNMVIWALFITLLLTTMMENVILMPIILIICALIFTIIFILQIVYYRIFWYLVALQWTLSTLALFAALASGVQIMNTVFMMR